MRNKFAICGATVCSFNKNGKCFKKGKIALDANSKCLFFAENIDRITQLSETSKAIDKIMNGDEIKTRPIGFVSED